MGVLGDGAALRCRAVAELELVGRVQKGLEYLGYSEECGLDEEGVQEGESEYFQFRRAETGRLIQLLDQKFDYFIA